MSTLSERFIGKYLPSANGCWNWTAGRNKDGYGEIKAPASFGNRKFKAHRVSYELHVGAIPDGLVIDHKCKNTSCVNPDHLRAISKVENTMIGNGYMALNARRTACNYGHEFTKRTTIFTADGKRRRCRTCKNEAEAARKRAVRAAQRAANG